MGGEENKQVEEKQVAEEDEKAGSQNEKQDKGRPGPETRNTEGHELFEVLKNAYISLDTDHNGHLDEDELKVLGLKGESNMEAYDTDHSGTVSLEEYLKESLTEQGYGITSEEIVVGEAHVGP